MRGEHPVAVSYTHLDVYKRQLFSRRSFYSYAAAQYGRRAALGCVRADIASSVRAFFGIPHGKKDAILDDAYANDDAFCVRECMKFEGEYARIMAEDTLK